jgi:hypothetical protein
VPFFSGNLGRRLPNYAQDLEPYAATSWLALYP